MANPSACFSKSVTAAGDRVVSASNRTALAVRRNARSKVGVMSRCALADNHRGWTGSPCVRRAPPGKVLIRARPVRAEGETEQQFLQRNAHYPNAGQLWQIPDSLDVTGREYEQSRHENGVVAENTAAANKGFASKVRTA